jgi:hypothetical protein
MVCEDYIDEKVAMEVSALNLIRNTTTGVKSAIVKGTVKHTRKVIWMESRHPLAKTACDVTAWMVRFPRFGMVCEDYIDEKVAMEVSALNLIRNTLMTLLGCSALGSLRRLLRLTPFIKSIMIKGPRPIPFPSQQFGLGVQLLVTVLV